MDNVLTAAVTLPGRRARRAGGAVDRTSGRPGAHACPAWSAPAPPAGCRSPDRASTRIAACRSKEQPLTDGAEGRWAVDYVVTPGLLETLRVRIVEGRAFTDGDGAGAPRVAIVNQAMARRFWPRGTPLGARIRQSRRSGRTVAHRRRHRRRHPQRRCGQPPLPYLYVPLAQQPARTMTITLRTAGDRVGARRSAAPGHRVHRSRSAALRRAHDARGVGSRISSATRLLIQVMGALAAIALGLAGLGVWGVAAQSVGQRTREIGVRVALGATAAQVAGADRLARLRPDRRRPAARPARRARRSAA